MTVGNKISLVCALLVVFIMANGVVALVNISHMDTAMQSVIGDALPGVYSISRAESVIKDMRGAMLTHVAAVNQEVMSQMESSISQNQQKAKEILKDYEKTV